jgi:hypothetical protein
MQGTSEWFRAPRSSRRTRPGSPFARSRRRHRCPRPHERARRPRTARTQLLLREHRPATAVLPDDEELATARVASGGSVGGLLNALPAHGLASEHGTATESTWGRPKGAPWRHTRRNRASRPLVGGRRPNRWPPAEGARTQCLSAAYGSLRTPSTPRWHPSHAVSETPETRLHGRTTLAVA